MTPTQRTLAKLRSEGWLCAIVEKFNHHVKIRQDLFGFGDILAVRAEETLLIQTTSGSNVSARLEKIRGNPATALWLACPTRKIICHGWAKRGARGCRKLWTCREVAVR